MINKTQNITPVTTNSLYVLKKRANSCCWQNYSATGTLIGKLFPWLTLYKADFSTYPQEKSKQKTTLTNCLLQLQSLPHAQRLGKGVFDTPGVWYPRRLWQGLLFCSQQREAWADGVCGHICIWLQSQNNTKGTQVLCKDPLYVQMQWHHKWQS